MNDNELYDALEEWRSRMEDLLSDLQDIQSVAKNQQVQSSMRVYTIPLFQSALHNGRQFGSIQDLLDTLSHKES